MSHGFSIAGLTEVPKPLAKGVLLKVTTPTDVPVGHAFTVPEEVKRYPVFAVTAG